MKRMYVGMCGQMRSGKDTAGIVMVKKFGFVRRALADCLKEDCVEFGWLTWDQIKKKDPYARHILQFYGTQLCRLSTGMDFHNKMTFSDDYWMRRLIQEVEVDHPEKYGDKIVITDIRFLNEAQWIIDRKGMLILIDADKRLQLPPPTHASEQNFGTIYEKFIGDLNMYISINNNSQEDFEEDISNCWEEFVDRKGQSCPIL